MGETVNTDLEIRADWEKLERGTPEERACFAAIGIQYGNVWLTEAEDTFVNRVRGQVHLSGYRLAEWLAWNWWRLRWEPRTRASDWASAHHMTTVGGGYVWPNVTVFSDGERIVFLAKPTHLRPTEPLRYIADIAAVVLAGSFEDAIDRFIDQVLGQLRAEKIGSTNLAEIWENVRNERADPEFATRRKLEALLGFDPNEADNNTIEILIKDAEILGQRAMDEVAAERPAQGGGVVITAAKLREVAGEAGFDSRPREAVRLSAETMLPHVGQAPAWRRGIAAARALRDQQNLDVSPMQNTRLAEFAGVSADALNTKGNPLSIFSFALDENSSRGRIVLRSKWETGRRFELARLIGDRVAGHTHGKLLPATHSYTYRQKFQRSFAAEFLCPFDAVDAFLKGDYSIDAIQGAADYFQVSPLTIRTLLVNHGRLAREDLEDDIDLAA